MTEEKAKEIIEGAKAILAMSRQMRSMADDAMRNAVNLHMDAIRVYHDTLKLDRKIRWRNYVCIVLALASLLFSISTL